MLQDDITYPTAMIADLISQILDPKVESREFVAKVLLYSLYKNEGLEDEPSQALTEESFAMIEAMHRGEEITDEDMQAITNQVVDLLSQDES
jgi:hypothetical protein